MILERLFVCHKAAKLQAAPAGSAQDVKASPVRPARLGLFSLTLVELQFRRPRGYLVTGPQSAGIRASTARRVQGQLRRPIIAASGARAVGRIGKSNPPSSLSF